MNARKAIIQALEEQIEHAEKEMDEAQRTADLMAQTNYPCILMDNRIKLKRDEAFTIERQIDLMREHHQILTNTSEWGEREVLIACNA